jgi:hypothetical protein
MSTKVSPQILDYVRTVGCANDCDNVIEINNGIPLPCKQWTNEESELLRERMLEDNQLISSGFVRRVSKSNLGNSNRIGKTGLDVGAIRTQDSGAGAVNECKVTWDTIRIKDFEKTFYVVNTEKNLQICVKDFIGTKWQDFVSDTYSDYQADAFADTDLADMIVAGIIEKYVAFVPKFMLLATCGGSGEDMHGDDGIFAKAYYASQGQYFHTLEYDMNDVETDFDNLFIQAIVGGDQYQAEPTDFGTAELYLLDFLNWINTRKEGRNYLFNASIDLTTNKMYVASNFATRLIDLRIVLNGGELVDWGCKSAYADQLAPTELQRAMLINDVPLLFQYENIDETNFAQKFKEYKKDFKQYLKRNGWDDITDSDIRIGIDPDLLLERDCQIQNRFLEGSIPINFMDQIGLSESQFVPLNALDDTGLFFMTINQNLLLLDDGSNVLSQITNMGRIRFQEACDLPGMVNILGGVPPIGSEVEAWGAFACNITDSWFVIDNELETREPCAHNKLNLACYDDDVKNECVIEATCSLSCSVDVTAVYNELADETTISVVVSTNTPGGTTLVYDLGYSLSDGTNASGISTAAFDITLPGDQTESGLTIVINGTIEAQIGGDVQCAANVVYSERFGEGDGYLLCVLTNTNDDAVNSLTDQLSVNYELNGAPVNVPLVDTGLDYSQVGDYPAIETEIEAIFPGVMVSLTNPSGTLALIEITDMPSYITNVTISSADTGNDTAVLDSVCA